MIKLKNLITEKQPDAAWYAAKKLQHDIFDFMSSYGRDPAMKARSTEIVDLHRAINRIVADLGQQVYHSQPGES